MLWIDHDGEDYEEDNGDDGVDNDVTDNVDIDDDDTDTDTDIQMGLSGKYFLHNAVDLQAARRNGEQTNIKK